jgi:hypothetical protein
MATEKLHRLVSNLLVIAVGIGRHLYSVIGTGMEVRRDISNRDERGIREDRVLFGAALAVSVTAFFQLVQSNLSSSIQEVSLACFAVSIPLTAVRVYVATLELDMKRKVQSKLLRWLDTLGMLTAFAGLVGIFVDASRSTGIIFLCLSLFSLLLALRVYFLLR